MAMKLNLIESLGNRGIMTECKPILKEKLEIDVGCAGVIVLFTTTPSGNVIRRGFNSSGTVVTINDCDIMQGISRIEFVRCDGVTFSCGEIHRNGRFIHTKSNADELIVALTVGFLEQEKKIEKQSKEISDIKSRYGISII
jgi:hypothetical protein